MRVKGWHPATGEVEIDLDETTAAMIRRGQVAGFSIATDADLEPETFRIERTHPGHRLRPFAPVTRFFSDEQMEDWDAITMTGPDGREHLMGHQRRTPEAVTLPAHATPSETPAVDPMDVTWPDGKFKVFPDPGAMTVEATFQDGAGIWSRILAEVHHRRLEETILTELSAIISERGKDAPGLLIIRTPSGEWAIKESEWLAPGSAVLSTMDQPDLMAVAQGDGWLYYRQGPTRIGHTPG